MPVWLGEVSIAFFLGLFLAAYRSDMHFPVMMACLIFGLALFLGGLL